MENGHLSVSFGGYWPDQQRWEGGRPAVAAWNVAHTMFVRMRWLLLSNSYRQQRKFFMLTSDIYWWYMFWHVFNRGVSLRWKTICILWQVTPLFPHCRFRTFTISISLPLVRTQLKEDGSSWTWLVLSVCVLEDAAASSLITDASACYMLSEGEGGKVTSRSCFRLNEVSCFRLNEVCCRLHHRHVVKATFVSKPACGRLLSFWTSMSILCFSLLLMIRTFF